MNENDIIKMLDKLTHSGVSRIKIEVDDNPETADLMPQKQYHHGRCDVNSPWAKGCAFDVLEDEE